MRLQLTGVAGDDELFVGGHHEGNDVVVDEADPSAGRSAVVGVGVGVLVQAEHAEVAKDRAAHPGGLLTDSTGEDEHVESAERDR